MTIATSPPPPPPTTHRPPTNDRNILSLFLLGIAFLLTLYTHNTCPTSESHMPCTTFNDFMLGLAVLLAYLAAVGFYTSQDGRILFPLAAACYFGVWGGLVLFGVDDLRAGLGAILGVEVGVVGVFLGVRSCWCGRRDGPVAGRDEEEARLVGEEGGCGDSGGDQVITCGGEDAVHDQVVRIEEKGDGRVGNGDDEDDVRVVKESEIVPGS